MRLNQNIIHCFAKVTKSSVIKEKTWIILRKINVKRIFVGKMCVLKQNEVRYLTYLIDFCRNF